MYSISNIEKWKSEVQNEINTLLERRKKELQEIVKKELPKGVYLSCEMGACTIEKNKKIIYNEKVDNFTDLIASLSYSDTFETGVCVGNIEN